MNIRVTTRNAANKTKDAIDKKPSGLGIQPTSPSKMIGLLLPEDPRNFEEKAKERENKG